ncbi:MAG: PAS domain S-box protein [Spirochaetaceae bacterium]|nr:PAS domain S-box protein [Spirochaetaceae bacterium]MBP5329910.1 PAS domain S-box protein [Spirochaetaceae bacterium]
MQSFEEKIASRIEKLSKEQLLQLFSTMNEKKSTFDAVLSSLSIGLLVCDTDGFLYHSNKAAERLLSFSVKNPIPGDSFASEKPVWNLLEDQDIADFLKDFFDRQKAHASEEFTVQTPGGSPRILIVSAMPLVQEKKLKGILIQIEDVTERRNQQTLLRRMENLASLTNLAASVAHEIKNPLGSISIHIQLIQKALKKARETDGMLPDPKFTEHYLDIVNEEIERLNKIIVDFLFAVRPISATLVPLDINNLIRSMAEFIKPELDSKKIELQLDLMTKAPDLMLDEQLTKQVIINLVQNSVAAMKNGGILYISTKFSDDKIILTIADNGEGMDEQTLSRIFEPYFTTKANGTGLGLTMVYKIIKETGGDIHAKSFPGEGTVFTISLPVPQKELRLIEQKEE